MKKQENAGLVYSTESGRCCPCCNAPVRSCRCAQKEPPAHGDGIVRVMLEKKGRKGKGVTIITGLAMTGDRLKETAKRLKQLCGSGGTVKNGVIEIQGDHRDQAVTFFSDRGLTVKRVGGP